MTADTKIISGSLTFFVVNNTAIALNAIKVVGMSLIVRMAMTTTAPARAPTTAAVIPSTNAFMLACFEYLRKYGAGKIVNK